MAGGKQSPRQKMINMMYLVLTALLALNISKDILQAFAVVEHGYADTVKALDEKNTEKYKQFTDLASKLEEANVQLPIANSVKAEAKEIVDHIEKLRNDIIALDGEKEELDPDLGTKLPEKMDDKEGVANMLLQKEKRGEKLRLAIDKYREFLLNLDIVNKSQYLDIKKDITKSFDTNVKKIKGKGELKWENHKFEHYPKIAILTFLRQIESDVVKAESDVVDALFTSIGKSEYSFDSLTAMIVPERASLMAGEKFSAKIFVTAFDSKQNPSIKWKRSYNGPETDFSNAENVEVQNGMGNLEFVAGGVGEHTIGAEVTVIKSTGEKDIYSSSTKYTVNSPTAVVSPTKMNVFYIGVENPIAVSVPGVDSKGVRVSVSGATAKGTGKGTYGITVPKNMKGKTVKVSVNANGRTIGKPHEFRVKRIPNPIATISGKVEGTVSKGLILRTPGIRAALKDFPFDLKYRVNQFRFTIKDGDYVTPIPVKGDLFTPEIKEKIRKCKPGTSVSFTNIRAIGPGGVKPCPPVVFTVQ
ncbi:MAG: gliding motility protein GldM [Flavobacteriales bacterium]